MADNVLYMGVRGVTDLMMAPGLVNLDFADVRTVMAEMGKAMMGTGEAEGENRAVRAAEQAISNPLLEDTSMAGARGLLINITGGEDMTLFEVDQAANRIREEVAEDANIIFGSAVDESLSGRVRVSVVATGIDMGSQAEAQRPRLVAVGGGAPAFGAQPIAAQSGPQGAVASIGTPSFQPAQLLTPRAAEPMFASEAASLAAQPAAALGPLPGRSYVPPAATPRPASAPRTSAIFSEPPQAAPAPQPAAPAPSPARSLFGMMTRGMRGRLTPEATPEPQRAEPGFAAQPAAQAQPIVQPQHPSDEALEIPAFLRRQSS